MSFGAVGLYNIPQHAFIWLLACEDRLQTRCRLYRMGLVDKVKCALCSREEEHRDHVFFLCPHSWAVTEGVLGLVMLRGGLRAWEGYRFCQGGTSVSSSEELCLLLACIING
ncbi:hypothetical protein Ancab_011592 [Ancistrocladus abbreviatus]